MSNLKCTTRLNLSKRHKKISKIWTLKSKETCGVTPGFSNIKHSMEWLFMKTIAMHMSENKITCIEQLKAPQ